MKANQPKEWFKSSMSTHPLYVVTSFSSNFGDAGKASFNVGDIIWAGKSFDETKPVGVVDNGTWVEFRFGQDGGVITEGFGKVNGFSVNNKKTYLTDKPIGKLSGQIGVGTKLNKVPVSPVAVVRPSNHILVKASTIKVYVPNAIASYSGYYDVNGDYILLIDTLQYNDGWFKILGGFHTINGYWHQMDSRDYNKGSVKDFTILENQADPKYATLKDTGGNGLLDTGVPAAPIAPVIRLTDTAPAKKIDAPVAPATNPMVISNVLGSVGMLGGLYWAHKQKSGFWGYVGYAILGSVVGGTVGKIGDTLTGK